MSRRSSLPSVVLLLTIVAFCSSQAMAQPRPKKKIVEYGWDVPYPDFVRDNIGEMEKRPFDGIIFRTNGFDHAFDVRPWDRADLQPQLDTLGRIRWSKFTDNFLTLYAANKWNMDWFNDSHWKIITANMELFSQGVRTGNCVGVCFDPEPYGDDPWVYPGPYAGKSFDEVAAQVRRRGQQFMAALQQHKPDLKVLSFFQLSLFPDIVDEPDQGARTQKLQKRSYALLPAFCMGILDGATSDAVLIDGNESAYYYESAFDFLRGYHLMRQRAMSLVPESLRRNYNAHVQAGMALYIDQALATRTDQTTSHFLNHDQQLKLFEHNVYYALGTADEYVWCYSERMNWWLPPEKAGPDRVLPAGVEEALVSARQKYEAGKPLGFDIADMIKAAHEERQKAEAGKKQ